MIVMALRVLRMLNYEEIKTQSTQLNLVDVSGDLSKHAQCVPSPYQVFLNKCFYIYMLLIVIL